MPKAAVAITTSSPPIGGGASIFALRHCANDDLPEVRAPSAAELMQAAGCTSLASWLDQARGDYPAVVLAIGALSWNDECARRSACDALAMAEFHDVLTSMAERHLALAELFDLAAEKVGAA